MDGNDVDEIDRLNRMIISAEYSRLFSISDVVTVLEPCCHMPSQICKLLAAPLVTILVPSTFLNISPPRYDKYYVSSKRHFIY